MTYLLILVSQVKAVQTGQIKIKPESAERHYLQWMANINDWCISRQLWWGHQCPVYRIRFEGEEESPDTNDRWFAGRNEEEGLAVLFQHLLWASSTD